MPQKFNWMSLMKWAIVLFVVYSIWKCVAIDRENFQSGQRESFESEKNDTTNEKGNNTANAKVNVKEGMCSGDPKKPGSCISATGSRLLPVLDPCFNMREICKQSILLEDHLFQNEKRCEDCIKKHFLTIEGLAEEAITLDKENKYNFSKLELPERVRLLEREFLDKKDPESIAQQLRQIRKPLMAEYFHKF